MKAEEFRRLTAELEKLTPHQKQLLTDRLRASGHATQARELIESRVGATPVCPHCRHSQVSRWGKSSGLQRYRCGACHATFNALTGTPLARLRKKDKWLTYAQQMGEGQSVRKSATACEVHRNTAFRWRHRFLDLPDSQRATLLSGIAEADETVFLESFKGKSKGLGSQRLGVRSFIIILYDFARPDPEVFGEVFRCGKDLRPVQVLKGAPWAEYGIRNVIMKDLTPALDPGFMFMGNQMDVVGHEAIGEDFNPEFFAVFLEP